MSNFGGDPVTQLIVKGPFKRYVTLFSWKFDPHLPPRNANNVEPYTFVTLFSGESDTPPPPTALRNTWMAPNVYQIKFIPQIHM